jgi:hypothetical protein
MSTNLFLALRKNTAKDRAPIRLVMIEKPNANFGVPGHSAESTSYRSFCKCKLRGNPLSHSGLDHVPDQPPVSFHEGKLVRKTAFQQYADGKVAR